MFNNLECKFDLPKLLIVFESFSVYWKKMFAGIRWCWQNLHLCLGKMVVWEISAHSVEIENLGDFLVAWGNYAYHQNACLPEKRTPTPHPIENHVKCRKSEAIACYRSIEKQSDFFQAKLKSIEKKINMDLISLDYWMSFGPHFILALNSEK